MELLEYSYISIKNDLLKLFLLCSLAISMGVWKEFILTVTTMSLIRVLVGGIHQESFWSCFFFSLFYISLNIVTAVLLKGYTTILFIITVVSTLIPFILSPKPSNRKKALSERQKSKRKRLCLILEIMFVIFAVVIKRPEYKACIYTSVINSNLQLLYINRRG